MNTKTLFYVVFFTGLFLACKNKSENKTNSTIDYSNKKALDSLIRATNHSSDTMFLGFVIGMSKSDYQMHIEYLKAEGKEITYRKANSFRFLNKNFDYGPGYTFKTKISTVKAGKEFTGTGTYTLRPNFNKDGALMELNILPIEKWDSYTSNQPKWLEPKLKETTKRLKDKSFKEALINYGIIDRNDFIRTKGNLLVYKKFPSIKYIDRKTLLAELFTKLTEKEIIQEENKDIAF